MGKKEDHMFPCRSIPFSEEGLKNFDKIFKQEGRSCQKEKDIQKVRGKEKVSNGK